VKKWLVILFGAEAGLVETPVRHDQSCVHISRTSERCSIGSPGDRGDPNQPLTNEGLIGAYGRRSDLLADGVERPVHPRPSGCRWRRFLRVTITHFRIPVTIGLIKPKRILLQFIESYPRENVSRPLFLDIVKKKAVE
jgi:hypothetical protein